MGKLNLTTLLERRVRGDIIELFKIQKDSVCYGSDLFGRSGRTVAARSKTHRFTTRETDFFAQRVICYWNKLPAEVKCSESVTITYNNFKLINKVPEDEAVPWLM